MTFLNELQCHPLTPQRTSKKKKKRRISTGLGDIQRSKRSRQGNSGRRGLSPASVTAPQSGNSESAQDQSVTELTNDISPGINSLGDEFPEHDSKPSRRQELPFGKWQTEEGELYTTADGRTSAQE